MKKGDKYEDGGRVLVVDEVLNNGKYLTHVLGKVGEVEVPTEEDKAPTEEELMEMAKEYSTAEDVKEPTTVETIAEFKCQYCGKVCKSDLGLKAHERSCKKNPNK